MSQNLSQDSIWGNGKGTDKCFSVSVGIDLSVFVGVSFQQEKLIELVLEGWNLNTSKSHFSVLVFTAKWGRLFLPLLHCEWSRYCSWVILQTGSCRVSVWEEDKKRLSVLSSWNGRTILPWINGPIVNFKLSIFFYILFQLLCHNAKLES